jgi:hypothetical protein
LYALPKVASEIRSTALGTETLEFIAESMAKWSFGNAAAIIDPSVESAKLSIGNSK